MWSHWVLKGGRKWTNNQNNIQVRKTTCMSTGRAHKSVQHVSFGILAFCKLIYGVNDGSSSEGLFDCSKTYILPDAGISQINEC